MAEEEVVAQEASPLPSDHKRKHEDLEQPEKAPEQAAVADDDNHQLAVSSAEPDEHEKADDGADEESPEAKRLRLDENKPDELGTLHFLLSFKVRVLLVLFSHSFKGLACLCF